jgi:hypothetical protein
MMSSPFFFHTHIDGAPYQKRSDSSPNNLLVDQAFVLDHGPNGREPTSYPLRTCWTVALDQPPLKTVAHGCRASPQPLSESCLASANVIIFEISLFKSRNAYLGKIAKL